MGFPTQNFHVKFDPTTCWRKTQQSNPLMPGIQQAGGTAGAAAYAYAEVRSHHLNMAQGCEQHRVRFQFIVAEGIGTWSSTATHTLRFFARAAAAHKALLLPFSWRLNLGYTRTCYYKLLGTITDPWVSTISFAMAFQQLCYVAFPSPRENWPIYSPAA